MSEGGEDGSGRAGTKFPKLTLVNSVPNPFQRTSDPAPKVTARSGEHDRAWARIARRRSAYLLSLFILMPVGIIAGFALAQLGRLELAWIGLACLLMGILVTLLCSWLLRSAPCPKCGQPYAGDAQRAWDIGRTTVPRKCSACALAYKSSGLE